MTNVADTDAQAVSDELKPCPFCGGEAERRRNPYAGDMSMAHCKNCGASAYDKKWNRRNTLPSSVTVKALEWDQGEAESALGIYSVKFIQGSWCAYRNGLSLNYPSLYPKDFGSEAAAKAAAFADYKQRILSALEPAPPGEGEDK